MPLLSVDYAYTHLASCREIGLCDIKVIQKQLVDPLTLFSWYVFNPSSTQNRGAKHHSRKKESALSFDRVEQMLFNEVIIFNSKIVFRLIIIKLPFTFLVHY